MPRILPLVAPILLATGFPAAAEDRPPNVVLIYADDLGWGDVGFNGRKEWSTPHLDALAKEGATFSRLYTAAVVCAPSRGALMTGKAPIHCGVSRNNEDLPASEVTIAEALKGKGYATALFGKWHHGAPREEPSPGKPGWVHPMDQGFDEFFGFADARHAWEKFPSDLWDGRGRVPVDGYADDLFADKAVDFIARHRDKSFFLYVPLISAHFLVQAPADEIAKHRERFADPRQATYAAMVTRMDAHVGRVVRALKEQGLFEETLLVFASDHGATFERGNQGASAALDSNHPFRGQKRTLWEGGIRVPGIATWPGRIPAGKVLDEPYHMTDLFPTFLAAAGGAPDPSWKVDGVSLLGAWGGKAPLAERTLFWEWRAEGADQVAAMRGPWKLVITRGGKPELFNVVDDPGERRDRSAEDPELTGRLGRELRDWLRTEASP